MPRSCLRAVHGKIESADPARLSRHCDGLAVFRHPSRNALPHAQFQAVDNFVMRVLRCAQNQFVAFENIDQAGIALHQRSGKFNNAVQYIVKSVRRTETNTDFVEYIYM